MHLSSSGLYMLLCASSFSTLVILQNPYYTLQACNVQGRRVLLLNTISTRLKQCTTRCIICIGLRNRIVLSANHVVSVTNLEQNPNQFDLQNDLVAQKQFCQPKVTRSFQVAVLLLLKWISKILVLFLFDTEQIRYHSLRI